MPSHGLGRLPLPRDERDFPARRVIDRLPRTARVRRFWGMGSPTMRIDQGDTGTCQGQAHTNLLIAGPIVHPDIPDLSDPHDAESYAVGVYVEATGDSTLQEGAYTRQVLKVLVARGLIGAYHRAASVDEMIDWVLNGGPICHGTSWFRSMDKVSDEYGNAYLRVDEASGVRGGHITCYTGVDLAPAEGPPYFRGENSWGPDWAHDGTYRIPIDDVRMLFVGDAFVLTEIGAT